MCGIGVILSASTEVVNHHLPAINKALAHRGPDDEGSYILTTRIGLTLGLTHRRLSILDLSSTGHQPMVDETTGNVIVFNGEIYNHRSIAGWLEKQGEQFVGTSDTEVLLKAYKHFGAPALLRRLRGMFAFALWDAEKQKLLIARDPCGIKPLYFAAKRDCFACASEAEALTGSRLTSGVIDSHALDSFLAFGSVQAPLCIYEGVSVLLPGHMMWVSEDGSVEEPVSYWSWGLNHAEGGRDAIGQNLKESIRRHLVADVPVAVFLSGGFDSTALTSLAAQVSEAPIKTFTIGFPEVPEMSEAYAASLIAARIGTEHHQVDLREAEFRNALPTYFSAMDQPSDDGLNVYLLSKGVAEAGIKACLHGVGGDELFGGYPSFRQVPMALKLSAIPSSLRRILADLVQGDTVIRGKLAALLRTDLSLLEAFLVRRNNFSFEQRRELLGSEPPLGRQGVSREWIDYAAARVADTLDTFGAISTLELAQYASNKLLVDGDVMSMAHGLELRFPLLDVDLIRSVLGTPQGLKVAQGRPAGKPALTSSVAQFPTDLMKRRKQGFTLPLEQWMRRGMGDDFRSLFTELVVDLGLERPAVERTWRRLEKSRHGHEWLRAWQLFSLGCWYRHSVESSAIAAL